MCKFCVQYKECKSTFLSNASGFLKEHFFFWNILRLRLFIRLVRVRREWESGRRPGGMLLAGEHRRTTGTFHTATLSSTNLTWSEPEPNPDLRCERSATNRVIQAQLSKAIAPPCYLLNSLLIRMVKIEISDLGWLQPEDKSYYHSVFWLVGSFPRIAVC